MTGNVMEITAPRGSIRLVSFMPFEEFRPSPFDSVIKWRNWRGMSDEGKIDLYSKKRKKFIIKQCKAIKAFMRQHKNGRRSDGKRH